MKTTNYAILTLLFIAAPVFAHGGGRGFSDFAGANFGFGGEYRDFGGRGGFGGDFRSNFFDTERIQDRFEDQFSTLQTKYDDGLANDTDFLSSTLYDKIVSKTEWLDDRYGLFVSGVERSIDRIDDLISTTNDDITYYNDLLADYQADTSLSETRLERIEAWIERITERLSDRVDSLTEKQATLQTNLPTYQTFQTTVDTFLSDILAAGGGTSDGATTSVASLMSSSMPVQSAITSQDAVCATSATSLTPTAAPEPSAAALVLLAIGAGCALSPRRSRRCASTRD